VAESWNIRPQHKRLIWTSTASAAEDSKSQIIITASLRHYIYIYIYK
jgi:hypothetical protein